MIQNLSPKDLALVIGVSESSLKRWVDEGRLVAGRTSGGHRRIPLHEAVRFIRDTHASIARPELLGLADLGMSQLNTQDQGSESVLLKALEAGRAESARGLVLAQFLATRSVASVFDGPLANAMHRIGELWRHSEDGIMIEHRATEIALDAIRQLRSLLPPVTEDAPVAMGATAPTDQHQLPSLMAATTLLEAGFRDVNLGSNLPIDSLIAAVRKDAPKIVWMSISAAADKSGLSEQLQRLAAAVSSSGASLLLGGRGICGANLPVLPSTHIVSSMAELAAFARGLHTRASANPRSRANSVHALQG